MSGDKLWGGRFTKPTDGAVESFHTSLPFDKRLYRQDIAGSKAHAAMLMRQGILTADEDQAISDGLDEILKGIEAGDIVLSGEDIHSAVEAELTKRTAAGKKLHTGRSRNDQVATDTRLYLIECADTLRELLKKLMRALVDTAEEHIETFMPGYTHLQKAQPVTLAHHLMAYFYMLNRDYTRLCDAKKRIDVCPLGSGALAGVPYPINRQYTAELLGFSAVSQNSMDAVSDRDFCIEFISCCSVIMMHLSRFCEEFILWASGEFAFIRLDDGYCTGSSIMPQKRNPDVAELIRGKTGRVYGSLMASLTMMKGLPLTYNKDMQEDKEQVFDAFDTTAACLEMFTGMFRSTGFCVDNMGKTALNGFTNATDIADYLVEKGTPFRDAHELSGKLVLLCESAGKALLDLSLEEFNSVSPVIEADIYDKISLAACVQKRDNAGAPAFERERESIAFARRVLDGK